MATPTPTSLFLPKRLPLFLNISFLILLFFFIGTYDFLGQSNNGQFPISTNHFMNDPHGSNNDGCSHLHDYADYKSKCRYVKSEIGCRPKGYINYLQIFYCTCGRFPFLGHLVLLIWLFVLFYLLGDTAANYFCTSLESLSRILKLSPAIAGVTLLSLGNGASDVFASIVSFTMSGNGGVGLNSILGGAFFISSAVVGVISILISRHEIPVDEPSFFRDVLFFLFSLSSLMFILFIGEITLWGALSFVSIYLLYVCAVAASHLLYRKKQRKMNPIPVSCVSNSNDNFGEGGIPLLGYASEEKSVLSNKVTLQNQVQTSNLFNFDSPSFYYFFKFLNLLELPLYLPRRLTIPVINEEKWSKPYAVISVTLAPLMFAELCNSQREKHMGSKTNLVTYMIAGLIGMVIGNLAFVTTKRCSPPNKCQLPWLAAGFLMSVTWTYFTAEELVSLLVSFGHILGISPSVLGLTVLAWGNSLGDLISNSTMAINGGADGVQTAISGCYAGPMFNTLVGLGVSLVCSAWSEYPSSFEIPRDPSLYETLAFLMAGLLWALVILPRKNMRLDRFLGAGLLAIYFCFLSLRLARAVGLLNFHGGFSFHSLKWWFS
ncbi:Sodium/calcium exchanger membrane region [Corchorus olitorius]|uniref:Sodium/calcium exchanger membrane region n=1 Tax=Corchorus olitorius TaxID=93759 RepID=A0A1R3HIZ2_9ROSI|nr:Sodium/calcium exchanger membrane region [Corchorus olitorius]